ncbi:uncharacterized protein EAF01_004597 [Botrytis porri]|uniref:uncharacterized protein n=1 Tax=Botrytis porri TaxID=87229 RepID=UPI00190216F4|nr:uncharacterized protein EAF01_004597 [Botrytis porri]KAF7907010.1 hypothetical protein EAF01_004597 [Botrytis porri]
MEAPVTRITIEYNHCWTLTTCTATTNIPFIFPLGLLRYSNISYSSSQSRYLQAQHALVLESPGLQDTRPKHRLGKDPRTWYIPSLPLRAIHSNSGKNTDRWGDPWYGKPY